MRQKSTYSAILHQAKNLSNIYAPFDNQQTPAQVSLRLWIAMTKQRYRRTDKHFVDRRVEIQGTNVYTHARRHTVSTGYQWSELNTHTQRPFTQSKAESKMTKITPASWFLVDEPRRRYYISRINDVVVTMYGYSMLCARYGEHNKGRNLISFGTVYKSYDEALHYLFDQTRYPIST